ncbi:acetyltransferase [Flavobacterium sp. J27]|uniref:acetyltransferase n=1 Tax=Flavobacterium sp. J27 TaxID=2060419 RepID=UPI00103137F0|nr:acetyltransferase [Flavobacterium sp. J27]
MKINHYVFGASGHAKVVLDILIFNQINVTAIVDDDPKFETLFDIPVIKTKAFSVFNPSKFIIAIGNNVVRKEIVAKNAFHYLKAIHNDAAISSFSSIGEGSVVMAKAVINADAKIGKHCIINSGSVIEHDCVLSDYVHVSPNASLAGNVTVGEGVHIGIGASVIQGVTIGKWATIGAGAVIIADVPDFAVVVGNPGKIIKSKSNE